MNDGRRRVLFLITRTVHGGAQAYVIEMLRAFGGEFDLTLGVGAEGHLTEVAHELGVPVRVLPELVAAPRPLRDLAAVRRVTHLVRDTGADLVSAHSTKAGLVGRAAAVRCGVPAIFTAHGWSFAQGIPRLRRLAAVSLEMLAARWCDRIIVVCEADRLLALHHRVAPPAKLVTVRYGVPDTVMRSDVAAPGTPVVAMVARFEPQKDHSCLLRALAGIRQPWRGVMVGDGPTRPVVEALARKLGIADRIEFLGSRGDVPEVLASAHVFALASRWEGLPLTILEAMRAGLPVVASNVGGVREAVIEDETGFLCPAGAVALLGRRLAQLFSDSALRARMGEAGRRLYEARFKLERMVEETRTVYSEVLADRLTGHRISSWR